MPIAFGNAYEVYSLVKIDSSQVPVNARRVRVLAVSYLFPENRDVAV